MLYIHSMMLLMLVDKPTPRLGEREFFPFGSHAASKWPKKLLSEKSLRLSSYHRGSLGESWRMFIGLIGGVPLL